MILTAGAKGRRLMPFIFLLLSFVFVLAPLVFADANFDKLFSARKYREALDYADANIPTDKRTPALWVRVGQANEALEFLEKALACYMVAWRLKDSEHQALVGMARIYNKMGQHDQAISMAQNALKVNPKSGDAASELANTYIKLKKPGEAKKALESIAATDTGNVVANRELGNIYYNEGDLARALPLMRRSYRSKADGEVAFRIGKAYMEISLPDSAVRYFTAAIDAKKNVPEASLYLARAQFGRKKYNEAATAFAGVDNKLMTAKDYHMLGHSKDKARDTAAALSAHQSAVRMFGNDRSHEALLSRAYIARVSLARKAPSAAIPHLEFIANADPKAATVKNVFLLLSEAYTDVKNNTRAIAALEKAVALNSKSVEAYVRLAEHYEKAGFRERAKATYEQMMNIGPNDPNVFLILGNYNLKNKRWNEAFEHFEKSASLKKSGAAFDGAAVALFNMGETKKALATAAEAVKIDSTLIDARAVMARVLIGEKKYKQAQEHAERIVKQVPSDLEYLRMLAECYEKNKEAEKLAETDKAIAALDSRDIVPRLRLAKRYESKKDRKTAAAWYLQVVSISPRHAESYRRLSAIMRADKQLPQAISHIRKYIEIVPNDAEAHRDLGDMLYEQKNLDGALAAYRTAIRLDPNLKGFYKRYAEILIAKGQTNEVITALDALVKNGDADAGTYVTLGTIYQSRKQWANAIEAYQGALKLEPSNFEAIISLAASQLGAGDVNAAVISYEQAVMMNAKAVDEHKILGDLYTQQKKNADATRSYIKYLDKVKADKVDRAIAVRIGRMQYEEKKYADAAKYLSLAGNTDPNTLLMYAEASVQINNIKNAIAALEDLKGRTPRVAQIARVLQLLADAYERDNKPDLAAKTYVEYIGLPGVKDADAAYKAAFLQEKTNPAAAIKIYEANTKTYPSDLRSHLRLGLMYSQKKETLQRALPLLKKCAEAADTVPQVWLELAKIYNTLNRDDDELDAYRKYAKTDPQHAETNKRIGALLIKKGDIDNAMAHLGLAYAMLPNDPAVMSLLAKGYRHSKRNKEAVDILVKAKSVKPDDLDIRTQLYELYLQTNQAVKAMEEIRQLSDMTKDTRYMLPYGEALIAQNKVKEAEDIADELLKKDSENADALLLRAKILRSRKDWDGALDVYKTISDAYPDHAVAYYERAETFMLADKPTWAETFYKRALRADPQMGLAELGLAKLYKSRKQPDLYKKHLEAALKLSPENDLILEEVKRANIGK